MKQAATHSFRGALQMPETEDIKTWFAQAIEANLDALFGVALRLTGNHTNAEDLVAESVTRAWSAIRKLEDRGRFRPWIFRILRNTYISDYRKVAVRPSEIPYVEYSVDHGSDEISSWLMDQPDEFLNWWANPEQEYINQLLGEEIMAALNKLPENFRMTILLINVEGLTYDEAAELLCIPKGTVRSRMKRGRTVLQKVLWQQAKDNNLSLNQSKQGAPDE